MSTVGRTPATTIAIADADDARRQALAALAAADPRVSLVGEARGGREALAIVERERPAVLIMGTAMPELDGLTTLRLLRARAAVAVVVIAEASDAESVLDALSLGARGYLTLEDPRPWTDGGLHAALQRAVSPGDPRIHDISIAGAARVTLVTCRRGQTGALGRLLRSERERLGASVFLVVDAPTWLVEPLARRLHRSTPWRVLAAREGESLAKGHVLVSTLDAGLTPDRAGTRIRLTRGPAWRSLTEAVATIVPAPVAVAARGGAPTPTKWTS